VTIPSRNPRSVKRRDALALDLDAIIPFLRAVSYAVIAQQTTRLEWRPDETPINYLYSAFFGLFGTPGTVDVVSAPEAEVRRRVRIETHRRIDVLMARAEVGPVAIAKYLAAQEELRTHSLKFLREQYADAQQINREIAREWGRGIEFLWNVKLGSQMLVKTVGVFSGGGGLVSIAQDVIDGVIDDWTKADGASGVMMTASSKAATELGKEAASKTAEKIVDRINGQATGAELKHAIAHMQRLEEKLSHQLTRAGRHLQAQQLGIHSPRIDQSLSSLSRQAVRNTGKLDAAQKKVATAAGKAALAKLVSVVFAAKDLREAILRRNAEVAAATH